MNQGMESRRIRSKKASLYITIALFVLFTYILGYVGSVSTEQGSNWIESASQVVRNLGSFNIFYPINAGFFKGLFFSLVISGFAYFMLKIDTERNLTYAHGKEKGTGGFMTKKDFAAYNKEYIVPEPTRKDVISENIVMSQQWRRPVKSSKIIGNNNVLIVGAAGTGKSRFYLKPNIMQMNASYVVTDPSGDIVSSVGTMLQEYGYKIKIFNIQDMSHSNCYNPIEYIRDEAGVNMVIDCFIKNTTGKGNKGDEFFTNAERLLYSACIYYLKDFCPDASKKNFSSILNMINASNVDENNTSLKSPLDKLFESLPTDSLAWKSYKAFKQAAGKTLKSIIISCVVRLQPFMTPQVVNLTKNDTLDLASIGDEKTALFIITPQADRTYSFLASMLYSQLFETLYYKGEQREASGGGVASKIPIRCLMDEFANIGEIPEFPQKLATMRKYGIDCTVILQDPSQLEAMYKEDWRSIIGNCSTSVFLGANEQNTLKYFSDMLGEQTITEKSRSSSKGKGGASKSLQQSARKVMTEDELKRLDKNMCVVYTQNMRPFLDRKFDLTSHLHYDEIADTNDSPRKFYYKKLSVFDNTKEETLESRLKALAELARLKDHVAISKSKKAEEERIDALPTDVLNNMELTPDQKRMLIEKYIDECQEKVLMSLNDPASITCVDSVPENMLPDLLETVSGTLEKGSIILFTNHKDGLYRGLAIDKDNIGLFDAARNDYAQEVKVEGRYCRIVINQKAYEFFKSETLSRINALPETEKPKTKKEKKEIKKEEVKKEPVEEIVQEQDDYEMDIDFV